MGCQKVVGSGGVCGAPLEIDGTCSRCGTLNFPPTEGEQASPWKRFYEKHKDESPSTDSMRAEKQKRMRRLV